MSAKSNKHESTEDLWKVSSLLPSKKKSKKLLDICHQVCTDANKKYEEPDNLIKITNKGIKLGKNEFIYWN